ncbi:pirin family protein [Treponema sp. OttesenSCG-928-L16]|nr:pirin family protein [Treponema sp. OttesenSCG-928-L16]
MYYRRIKNVQPAVPTVEGSSVFLKRSLGFNSPEAGDPFLLLDDLCCDNPAWYEEGFPSHPHRGFESLTYMQMGTMEYRDSFGNYGNIPAGGVQQLGAGSGIIHREIPRGNKQGKVRGFQLWINMPSQQKMTSPVCRDFLPNEIPELILDDRIMVRVVSGSFGGVTGPVRNNSVDLEFLDIIMPPNTPFIYSCGSESTVLAYVVSGYATFDDGMDAFDFDEICRGYMDYENKKTFIDRCNLILYEQNGNDIIISTHDDWAHFLLISGKPIKESIAWYGPIVMNKRWELRQAFEEYNNGIFLKQNTDGHQTSHVMNEAV